jgi:hypothetical protein
MRNLRKATLVALPLLAALPVTVHADDGIDWTIAPYIWLPTITTDVSTFPFDGGGGEDLNLPETLDELDGAFLMYGEGRGDHWGAFVNFLFLGLESDEEFDIALTTSDLDATILDAGALYKFGDDRIRGFEIYGGLRYVDVDYEIGIDPVNPAFQTRSVSFDESYSDFLLGGRFRDSFSDRWGYVLEADASEGDTEGTFSLSGRLLYSMGSGAWVFGWRYLDGEIATERNTLDIELNGPVVGYAFRF